jgi:outer membrane protein
MLFSISAYSQVSRNFHKNTQPKLEGGIGAVGFNIPNYPGSANNTFRYLPFPWIIYRSDFLQSDEEGTRAKIFSTRKFEIGLSGGLNFPIDSNTNKAREGMPDTDILVGVGPAFIFRIIEGNGHHRLTAGLGLRVNLSVNEKWNFTDQGWLVEPNLRYWATISEKFNLFSGLSFSFADRKYNQFFYDVPINFSTSERSEYRAKSGIVDIAGSIGISYDNSKEIVFFAGHFFSNLSASANRDSPLVENIYNGGYLVGFTWLFYESDEMVQR